MGFGEGTDVPRASPVSASASVKAEAIALRVRVSLDGSGCVYVRSVKPGSEWPRYSESSLMLSPRPGAQRRTRAGESLRLIVSSPGIRRSDRPRSRAAVRAIKEMA